MIQKNQNFEAHKTKIYWSYDKNSGVLYKSIQKPSFVPPRQDSLYKKQSTNKKQFKTKKKKMPFKRMAVKYAHASVARELRQAKVPHVLKAHGKDVVRIICRTVVQLQNLNTILKEFIQHNHIEEIGMPLYWAYKMKQLVLFIKPINVKFSKEIENKFKNSGLHFHITVFDVKNPYAKNKNSSKTLDDESTTKHLEEKSIAKIEKVKPIGASREAKQDKYPLLEVIKTLLLTILLGFVMFVIQMAAQQSSLHGHQSN